MRATRSAIAAAAALLAVAVAALAAAPAAAVAAQLPELPLAALAAAPGGRLLMLRHANAPGIGDPPGFKLGDCRTQRNLDAKGRRQAAATGTALRAALGPPLAARTRVYTSEWCRTRDTAALLGLGAPQLAPPLDSFNPADAAASKQSVVRLRAFLAGLPKDAPPTVLVTHQVDISALAPNAAFPKPVGGILLQADGTCNPQVLGTVAPAAT